MRHRLVAPLARALAWTGFAATLAACATTGGGRAAAPAGAPPTLYDRLGGKKAIATVVEDFVGRVGRDGRINQHFATTDLKRLKRRLTDQICQASGGPCRYKGLDMKTAHEGLGIRDADFDALVEDLAAAMTGLGVGKAERDDLVALLAPMRKDIVEQ